VAKTFFDEASQTYKGDNLYFIEDAAACAIKIGRGNDALSRLRSCQTGNPHDLVLLDEIRDLGWQEAFWHCCWATWNIRGEWFSITDDLLAAIRAVRAGEDWTDHVPPLTVYDCDPGEWREHLLDALEAYEEYVLIEPASAITARRAAEMCVHDPDFDGQCIMSQFINAGGGRVVQ
jgi:hypothetical protein